MQLFKVELIVDAAVVTCLEPAKEPLLAKGSHHVLVALVLQRICSLEEFLD